MQSLTWYLRRLRSMSLAEVAWRVRSLLRDQSDLIRIPAGILPTLPGHALSGWPDFEPGFRCRQGQGTDDREGPAFPEEWRAPLLQRANAILDDRLSYFDLVEVDHGSPFRWHRDHSAGIDSPVRLSVLTDYRDFDTYGDCKLVWEPNRHHQFVVLARAFSTEGNDAYAEKVAGLLRSWLEANPFGYGMNWKSPLELGVRIINWVWAIDLLRHTTAIDDELWRDVQRSVFLALWDIQRKYSRGSSANNHLIGEAAGVFVGACYFPAFPQASDWAARSQALLEREIELQTFADGGTREHAFGYQVFVIQFFTVCLLAGDASGRPFSSRYRQRLHRMYRFLHELARDTGAPPNMGDADDGYVLDLGDPPHTVAPILAVGAELFDDPSLAAKRPSETVYWITGKREQRRPVREGKPESTSLSESGYFLLRGSRMAVFFDCADLGFGNLAAHGHADCLSLCASVDGIPVFVDAGTYDYFTYPEWRRYFRETRAHNTAEVDGESQSELLGPFMWGRRAGARLIDWQDDERATTVVGEHDGYARLDDAVVHRRSVTLDKAKNSLFISDRFVANGRHDVRLHFHLDPACKIEQLSDTGVAIRQGDLALKLTSKSAYISCIRAADNSRQGWISNGYHRRLPSSCIRLECPTRGNTTIETLLEVS